MNCSSLRAAQYLVVQFRGKSSRLQIIEVYNPKVNAWITVMCEQALAQARVLEKEQTAGNLRGPLHGIPVLIKDNYDVAGLQTTGGSAALKGWKPSRDATIVSKLRAAGAIILAKTTMSEWARGGFDNINSVLPSFARNPYNTAHATGGSSGGTGSGLAASFGVVGLGSDTWGSIRNPSSTSTSIESPLVGTAIVCEIPGRRPRSSSTS